MTMSERTSDIFATDKSMETPPHTRTRVPLQKNCTRSRVNLADAHWGVNWLSIGEPAEINLNYQTKIFETS